MKCQKCNKPTKSKCILSHHIRHYHKDISGQDYYNLYFSNEGEGKCVICGDDTRYRSFTTGYNDTCSPSCRCKNNHQKLETDENRNQKFKDKVAANQKRIWKDRQLTGEAEIIRAQISITSLKSAADMSVEERKQKFGYINSLTPAEREEFIENEMKTTGMFKYYRELDDEGWAKHTDKHIQSRIINGTMIDPLKKDEWTLYHDEVYKLTAKTYKKYKEQLEHTYKRSREYQLDHNYSIFQGFMDGIQEEVIASIHNLEIIPQFENGSKNYKCSMSKELLMEKFNNG